MALHNIDMEAVFRRLAEKRIEEAMAEGKFDNLPGRGKPIDLEPVPADENARATWWALRLMKQNDFVPDEVKYRKRLDEISAQIDTLTEAAPLRALVEAHNTLVHKINTMGTTVLTEPVIARDYQVELTRVGRR